MAVFNVDSFNLQWTEPLGTNISYKSIADKISKQFSGISDNDFYLLHRGKILRDGEIIPTGSVRIVFKLLGGKGGFGSMLRAIGAQIEKTTNREACRDLSGRRLRDINEEKRLKKWIAEQADREKLAAEKKQKKLQKLCAEPRIEFNDSEYDKERADMPEKVYDAVEQGIKAAKNNEASTSTQGSNKRAKPGTSKAALWIDDIADDEDLSSSDSECEELCPPKKKKPDVEVAT